MKFTTTAILSVAATAAFTSTDAFVPANQATLQHRSQSTSIRVQPLDDDGEKTTTDALKNQFTSNLAEDKSIYDPMGLYPESSPERRDGMIQPSLDEAMMASTSNNSNNKPVTDPMHLYSSSKNSDDVSSDPDMSKSVPFLTRPPALDGSLAGDVGFDPLGFATSKDRLLELREAEVKHGRLAMLAAAGWPLSELFDRQLAHAFGLKPLLGWGDRVPSVLNGGLAKVPPLYWLAVLGAAAFVETVAQGRKAEAGDRSAALGDFGFDPFGLYPSNDEGKRWMELAEVKNGRLAMLAITGFALQEAVQGIAVVHQTPFFFEPISQYLEQLTNSGYVQ